MPVTSYFVIRFLMYNVLSSSLLVTDDYPWRVSAENIRAHFNMHILFNFILKFCTSKKLFEYWIVSLYCKFLKQVFSFQQSWIDLQIHPTGVDSSKRPPGSTVPVLTDNVDSDVRSHLNGFCAGAVIFCDNTFASRTHGNMWLCKSIYSFHISPLIM